MRYHDPKLKKTVEAKNMKEAKKTLLTKGVKAKKVEK